MQICAVLAIKEAFLDEFSCRDRPILAELIKLGASHTLMMPLKACQAMSIVISRVREASFERKSFRYACVRLLPLLTERNLCYLPRFHADS